MHSYLFSAAARERMETVVVLLAALTLFFVRLGDRGVVSEELRWAQVAREMRQSGDFLHPTINGKTYYDKPLGSYWLIVAASYLTGGVDETAARLPAALAGLLGVVLTMSLGRRFYGANVGVLAGAILATSFGFVFYARRATADVETVVGVLAALWLYARHREPGPWLIGLWTIMAATSLTKGLLGFALPVAVMAAHSAWNAWLENRSWRSLVTGQQWLFNRWSLLALPLAASLFAAPFILSIVVMGSTAGLELLFRENIRRFIAPHNHTGPIYLYVGAIFVLLAPWSLFLPAALLRKPNVRDASGHLIHAYFWAIFAFFTLSASRRNYYILPILPPAAILIAQTLLAIDLALWVQRLRNAAQWILSLVFSFAGIVLVIPSDTLPSPWNELPPLPYRGLLAFGWAIFWVAMVISMTKKRRAFASTLAAFAGLAFAFLIAMPTLDASRTRGPFAAAVREQVGDDSLALYFARDIVFDLAASAPVPEYRDSVLLANDLNAGTVVWVIARRRYLRDVVLPAEVILEEPVQPWEQAEQAGDRMVLLRRYGK